MGHKGKYLDESYFRAEEDRHLAEYRKAIPHLTTYATSVEEKKMRSKLLVDFAGLQGYTDTELKKLEETLASSKDVDEAITEFRRLREDPHSKTKTMHEGMGNTTLHTQKKSLSDDCTMVTD